MLSICYRFRRRCTAWSQRRQAQCVAWRTEWRQRCDRWRTVAETRCDNWQQEQRRQWDSWGPFAFICLLWVTVTTWVCKAWVTIVSTVCDLWVTVTSAVCDLWVTIVTAVCDLWTWVSMLVCDLWTFITTLVCRAWETFVESFCSLLCLFSRLTASTEHSFPMAECIYGWTARYRAELDRECTLQITLRIRLVAGAGVTATDIAAVQALWEPAIEQTWEDRFTLVLREGNCECRAVRVAVDVQFVTSGEHHVVNVRAGSGRADMGTWFVNSSGGTAAHEAGHMFGNPDEYADANCPLRTVTSDGSIMQTTSGAVKQRHYAGFAGWTSRRTCCQYEVKGGD